MCSKRFYGKRLAEKPKRGFYQLLSRTASGDPAAGRAVSYVPSAYAGGAVWEGLLSCR